MIIGETPQYREYRETQRDEAHKAAQELSELTGEPIQYIDPVFEFDSRERARINWALNRRPKCCEPKPPEPKCFGTYPTNPIRFKCIICDYKEDCYKEKKNDRP